MLSLEPRSINVDGGLATISKPAKSIGVIWLIAAVALASVVTLSGLLRGDAVATNAAVVNILRLDALALAPSGTGLRSPQGAHPAVVTTHAPSVPNTTSARLPATGTDR